MLSATGLEGESDLSYGCLTTLLRPLVGDIAMLARPRARALAAAMAIEDAPTEVLAVCSATLDLLGLAAERRPVLILLDDAQWIDHASAQAIRFAMLRLAVDRIAFLVAARATEPSEFDELGMRELKLDVLESADVAELLARSDGSMRRMIGSGVVEACRSLTGGNPLALRELAMSLDDDQFGGRRPLPSHLVLSADARRRFEHVTQLDPAVRRTLLIVAFDDTLRDDILLDAIDHAGLSPDCLDALESARILDGGSEIRFRHPLLRTVAIAGATRREAREAHKWLALATPAAVEVASEPLVTLPVDSPALSVTSSASSVTSRGWALEQSHAWHLAEMAGGVRPDAADALAAVAAGALRRGAPVAAARAWERAADLAAAEHRAGFLADGGEAFARAAMHASAADLYARALLEPLTDEVRSRATFGHVDTLLWQDTRRAALLATREATMLETEAPRDAARLLIVAATAWSLAGDLGESVRTARLALRAIRRADPTLWDDGDSGKAMESAMVESIGAAIEVYCGRETEFGPLLDGVDALVVALDLNDAAEELLIALQHLAIAQIVRERWIAADHTLAGIRRGARKLGVAGMESFGAALVAELGWRRGRWAESLAALDINEGDRVVRVDRPLTFGHAVAARIRGAQGSEEAVADASAVVDCAEDMGMVLLEMWARHSLGVARLARGEPELAAEVLYRVWELNRIGGTGEAGLVWWHGDLLDALVHIGRIGDARLLIHELEAQAASTGRLWTRHVAVRGRAMVSGPGPTRDALFSEAIELASSVGARFEEARTLLSWGEAGIADGEKQAAVTVLSQARERFMLLGSRPFADRAERQLNALGTAVSTPGPSTIGALLVGLTQAELRVAIAIGRGMTNREAAEDLFLSVRTVGWHLGAVYRKLGVRSRSELAAALTRELIAENR